METTAEVCAKRQPRALAQLLLLCDIVASAMLAFDLAVIVGSVLMRSLYNAPVEWSDDVARGLMVGSSFFGAASALARAETPGIDFVANRMGQRVREIAGALAALVVLVVSALVALNAFRLGLLTTGQTTGSGLPLELTFYPMAAGAALMTVFALDAFLRRPVRRVLAACLIAVTTVVLVVLGDALAPDAMPPSNTLMLLGFLATLASGVPIGFAIAFAALIFVWIEGSMPGVIFAQQMARGIDNFVLLAIPFFILVGYLMEVNGMSVRLIQLIQRGVGQLRGGINVVIVLSMVLFSGISGSKMADVAAVGSVLIPAARRSKQDPGEAVALLAASAVMAETIPPCINLIILGFVANLSIGGLFMAGLLPALLMAAALAGVSIAYGTRPDPLAGSARSAEDRRSRLELWGGAAVSLGLIAMIFIGFKTGFATATEISAFAALYAIVAGSAVLRELGLTKGVGCFMQAARRSGLVLFIVAAAQALAFTLTLQQIPHALAEIMVGISRTSGPWLFMLLSIGILIVMGSVLEGAAALIIFGPLLVPVATLLGFAPLHFGIVLVIAMGIGLFAPPLGLGLYGACLIGGVPIEATVKPILFYLGVLLLCLLAIAFLPAISTAVPSALGY